MRLPALEPGGRVAMDGSEASKGVEHLAIGEVGIAAAGVGQDEHARAFEQFPLKAKRQRGAGALAKRHSKERHADEGDHRWFPAPHFSAQRADAGGVFLTFERIDAWRRPRD